MDKKKILITLQNNKDKLQKLGVRNIGLFGSFVKERQKDNSDLDFVVEFRKGQKNYDNYIELKFFLEELFDKEIDLVTSESIKPELKAEIMESVEYAWLQKLIKKASPVRTGGDKLITCNEYLYLI